MKMQLKLIWYLMKKDWEEAFRSKQVVLSSTLLPLFMAVGVPLILMFSMNMAPMGSTNVGLDIFMDILPPVTPDWDQFTDQTRMLVITSVFGQIFLLLVPVMIASFVSADTIVGEKERQTIEGLLALPISDSDILSAKIGSSLLPILVLTWIMSGIYAFMVDLITYPYLERILLPDLRFILVMLIFTPLLGIGTITFIVMISSRVSSTRDAQQLSGIFVLPAIVLIAGQLIIVLINIWLLLVGILILGGFDIIAFKLAITMFNREKLMSLT
ncbi:MAG: ABC transporter permease subunit [Candidatus Heimdallarchaeota archaeon]|nr:MAG: ABC transporter permease subunit [Candidatus Heimdallarchaeota archaeon]